MRLQRPAGANEYVVSRSFLQRSAEDSALRVVPHDVAGELVGIRLEGVRADSTPSRLGLRDGDELVSVNGVSVSEPDSVLRAYETIRSSTSAELVILRRGRRVVLRYTILG